MLIRLSVLALLVLAVSCGHKDTQTTTTTTTAQTPSAAAPVQPAPTGAAGGAMSGGAMNGGAMNGAAHAGGAGNPPGYDTEAAAQSHCPSDQVVWLNTRSHVYHEKGTRYYGTTKQGEYACRKEADAAGDRNSKA